MFKTCNFRKFIPALMVLGCCLWFPPNLAAQDGHFVDNVSFQALDENLVVIHYDLFGRRDTHRYHVSLLLKQTANPRFEYQPSALVGAVGTGQFVGSNNKIIWSMDHEDQHQFVPDIFNDNYYFVIEARRKRSGIWFMLPILAGGITYLYLSGGI